MDFDNNFKGDVHMPLNTENETPDVKPHGSIGDDLVTWKDIESEKRDSDAFYMGVAVLLLIIGGIIILIGGLFVSDGDSDAWIGVIGGISILLFAAHFHMMAVIMRKIPTNHTIAILKILYEMYKEQHTELQETEPNSAQDIDK